MSMNSWIEKNTGNKNGVGTGGVGYVVIPSNVTDVGTYVNNCYRTNQITIAGDGYGVMSHVKVTNQIMPHIEFPNNDKGKGSLVIWVRESFYNRPVVVGILSDNNTPNIQGGGQMSQRQSNQGVSVEFLQDAVNAIAQIYACGNASKPARVVIKSAGSEDDDVDISATRRIKAVSKELVVESTESFTVTINNGEQEIITIEGNEEKLHFKDYNGNEITLNQIDDEERELKKNIEIKDTFGREYLFDDEKAELKDQFGHIMTFDTDKAYYKDDKGNEATFNEDNIQFKCNKFNLGDGAEPMVLGNTLKDLLGQILDAINAITVPTPHGPSGTPINSSQFSAIKGKLSTILSKLSNTD